MVLTGDSKSLDNSSHGAPQKGACKDDFSSKKARNNASYCQNMGAKIKSGCRDPSGRFIWSRIYSLLRMP